jgi:hypothetical protein
MFASTGLAILAAAGIASASTGSGSFSTSTVYATQVFTVTECAESVTDCPARVVTSTVSVSTTLCPVEATHTPIAPNATYSVGPTGGYTGPTTLETESGSLPEPTTPVEAEEEEPSCPAPVVKTLTTEVATVITTTYLVTETPDCGSGVPTSVPVPAGSDSVPVPVGTATGALPSASNVVPTSPPVTAGAGALAGSAAAAMVAGLVAFLA